MEAATRLRRLGYDNVGIHIGDGSLGWAEHAPYDKIIVTAAAEVMPPALLQQLRPGGRMVLPTGLVEDQRLTVVEKDGAGRAHVRELCPSGSVCSRRCGERRRRDASCRGQ
jgi:protein-L-isoaspartate(D-aspartate) O-methyltransferase